VGCDIDLAKYIAEKLGVELRIVSLDFTAVLSSVTEGKYDMAISGLAWTPARQEAMEMSKGYYFSEDGEDLVRQGILIRDEDAGKITDADSLAGLTVAYQAASLQEFFVTDQCPADVVKKPVNATTDVYLAVQEKKADAGIVSKDQAILWCESNTDAKMHVIEEFNFYQDEATLGTRIGIPKGETELLDAVNAIIDEVIEQGLYIQWRNDAIEYAKSLGV